MGKDREAKVIQLHNDKNSIDILKKLIEKLKDDKLDSLVIMAYEPTNVEGEDSRGVIYRYWFAENTLACLSTLGLIDYAKYMIRAFMLRDVDIVRGDEE